MAGSWPITLRRRAPHRPLHRSRHRPAARSRGAGWSRGARRDDRVRQRGHYDNDGTDFGEALEIAGPAGTDLSGWSSVLYNGTGGATYGTRALGGTIPDQQEGFGTVSSTIPASRGRSSASMNTSSATPTSSPTWCAAMTSPRSSADTATSRRRRRRRCPSRCQPRHGLLARPRPGDARPVLEGSGFGVCTIREARVVFHPHFLPGGGRKLSAGEPGLAGATG